MGGRSLKPSLNPTRDVKPIKVKSDGFHSWSEAEIPQFEARHAIGSKARLAFSLLLYTGQRRGDVIAMAANIFATATSMSGSKRPAPSSIFRSIPELDAIIATAPANMTFLVTEFGKPFTAAGFGNWFRDRCNEAGLRHCSAHGLRKAASRRLAEFGCTVHEVAAITGHASLREVQRYTKGADQKRLATSAVEKIRGRTSGG